MSSPATHATVQLAGRLGAQVHERTLPSGDALWVFGIVVDRPARERHGRTSIDTIACFTTSAAIARRVTAMEPGDAVAAEGVLRRRFWRAPHGLGSAMEVDVRRFTRA